LIEPEIAWQRFSQMRAQYAGSLNAMARHFHIPPAQWIGDRSFLRGVHHVAAPPPIPPEPAAPEAPVATSRR
jgi:hypothetical protein